MSIFLRACILVLASLLVAATRPAPALAQAAAAGSAATPSAAAPGSSAAPDPATEKGKQAEGRARYERGAEAYANGRFKDAIDLFLQADALAPSAPLSFNIARSYEKIGDGAAALQWYRDFRRRAPDHKNGRQVDEQIRTLEAELAKKGVQQLSVLSSPLGATVIIDEQPVGVTPFTGQFPPGSHKVVVALRGYLDSEQQVDLPAERARDLNVPLVPDTRTAAEREANGDANDSSVVGGSGESGRGPAADRTGPRFGILPWVGLGAGAVALGGALGFELARRSSEKEAKAEPTQIGYKAQFDRMQSQQLTARVLGAVGGALVLAGGVLLVIDLGSRPTTDGETAALSFACLTQGCAIDVKGRF